MLNLYYGGFVKLKVLDPSSMGKNIKKGDIVWASERVHSTGAWFYEIHLGTPPDPQSWGRYYCDRFEVLTS